MIRVLLSTFSTVIFLSGAVASGQSAKPTQPAFKGFGQNFFKADGSSRTMAIFLYDGMTAQDFVGIYSILNFASGADLKVLFVANKKGVVHDERGRLNVVADYSIDDVKSADIFIVPGGTHFSVVKDKRQLEWVKKMYDSSEYTASICTGSVILAAAGAIKGLEAGVAWPAKEFLAPFDVKYVPTPPPSRQGKYFSAAGAAAGIEIGLMLLEQITGSKQLSEVIELAAEWSPHMLYGSGNPQTAPAHVFSNFSIWAKSDPLFTK